MNSTPNKQIPFINKISSILIRFLRYFTSFKISNIIAFL